MATYSLINDEISLSTLDLQLLVSLLEGPSNGYDLTRATEILTGRTSPLSTSNVYKALKAMQKMMLVASVASKSPDRRQKTVFRISSLGRTMLKHEIAAQARFIAVAQNLIEETNAP